MEPIDNSIRTLTLDIAEEDTERLTKLIGIVHKKIMTLDFPDTDKYSKDAKGIVEFEDDLLDSRK